MHFVDPELAVPLIGMKVTPRLHPGIHRPLSELEILLVYRQLYGHQLSLMLSDNI